MRGCSRKRARVARTAQGDVMTNVPRSNGKDQVQDVPRSNGKDQVQASSTGSGIGPIPTHN